LIATPGEGKIEQDGYRLDHQGDGELSDVF
jgi:hypothetical protein